MHAEPYAPVQRTSNEWLVHLVAMYRGARGVSLTDLVHYCATQGLTEEQTLRAARNLRDRGHARFILH